MQPKYSRYSPIVRFRGLPNSAGMKPSILRTVRGFSRTEIPWIRISPLSGTANDEIIRNSVVFPAPFGPISPNVWPLSTRRLIRSTATMSSKRLVMRSISTATWLKSVPVVVRSFDGERVSSACGPDRCFVFESAAASGAVSTPYLQFPTITGFVNGDNSDRAVDNSESVLQSILRVPSGTKKERWILKSRQIPNPPLWIHTSLVEKPDSTHSTGCSLVLRETVGKYGRRRSDTVRGLN